ncbi:hypothetical protein BST92_03525 [Nonlabens arenilitoris]|uniref:Lipoprotein n=1 Tax=Nonlabens arenilitoris TaxID=1217969 RepID=A0A2S7U920_9FLAO|nr:hypothetical protein [Nonlabens arenilitoris]PQJ31051.1 hypothetical protein BST92_03525 [Nonlabens arenilitoris]
MKNLQKGLLILLTVISLYSCTQDNMDSNSRADSQILTKSISEDSEITAMQYFENSHGVVPTLLETTEIIEVERGTIGLSKFQIQENTQLELFATINLTSGNIIHAIEIDWSANTWNMKDVYWNEIESGLLNADGFEINQGDDLISIAEINSAAEQQNYTTNSRVRGFGWTCGPVVESPGGNYRTCCHRLFWRRTKPCDQYGTGALPGRNPRIISVNR